MKERKIAIGSNVYLKYAGPGGMGGGGTKPVKGVNMINNKGKKRILLLLQCIYFL